jgi:hypothetical protein
MCQTVRSPAKISDPKTSFPYALPLDAGRVGTDYARPPEDRLKGVIVLLPPDQRGSPYIEAEVRIPSTDLRGPRAIGIPEVSAYNRQLGKRRAMLLSLVTLIQLTLTSVGFSELDRIYDPRMEKYDHAVLLRAFVNRHIALVVIVPQKAGSPLS